MEFRSACIYQKFYCQRFNVNVTDLICNSFCWGNDYSFMWSYHFIEENWQETLVELFSVNIRMLLEKPTGEEEAVLLKLIFSGENNHFVHSEGNLIGRFHLSLGDFFSTLD